MKSITIFALLFLTTAMSALSQKQKKYEAQVSRVQYTSSDTLLFWAEEYLFQDSLGNSIALQTYPTRSIVVRGDTSAIFRYLYTISLDWYMNKNKTHMKKKRSE